MEFYTLVAVDDSGRHSFDVGGVAHRKICSYQYLGVAKAQRAEYAKYNGGKQIRILHVTFGNLGASVHYVDE